MDRAGFAVRAVRPADAAEWLRLRAALWPGEAAHSDDIVGSFERGGAGGLTLVAYRGDGRLGGTLELGARNYAEGCVTSPVAYVEGLFVDPDLRRQGVATALLAAAESWAKAVGHSELASDAVPGTAVSLAWHGRLGFAEVERIVCFRKAL